MTAEYLPVSEEKAVLELALRYFTNFAPATVHDAMYFFGVSARKVKGWLEQLPVTDTVYEGKTYYSIDCGRDYSSCKVPECLFLAGFDQLMMGYEKNESLFLPQENMRAIFTAAGIVRPTVLLDGEVAGWWSKKQDRLSVSFFDEKCTDGKAAAERKALELWPDIKRIDFKS